MNALPEPRPDDVPPPATRGVALLDLGRQYSAIKDEIAAALLKVCETGQFVLGPAVTQLERDIAAYCQAKHAVGCASGSDALLLALMALDVGPGHEVILPSFTFFATASAVTRLGARPVFADIDPETFNIDPIIVRRLVNRNTKAIIPVHLFGQCAQMNALCGIGRGDGVAIIEDAAQAIGAEFDGRRAGSIGEIGCLSFYPTKNLGGGGDGGMLTTSDDALAERLRLLRGHGMQPRYYHRLVGVNSRLDSLQAAILNVKLPHLERWTEMRQVNAARYTELFTAAALDRVLRLPCEHPQRRHVWNQYVVRVPDGRRDALRTWLAEAKIGSEIYYPLGLHQQECFRYLGYAPGDLPHTEQAAEEVLALPIYAELTNAEQQLVVARIAAFFSLRCGGHELAGPKFLSHPAARDRARSESP
jgi:dTDP-4-amino-4,6-dideoxygalactose transaminase